MYPHERSLVKRMRGRPFVLLGVNSDGAPDVPRSLMRDGVVTWNSWTDGGEVRGGEIAHRWGVQALPAAFILDTRGVIRHKVGPRPDDHDSPYLLDGHGGFKSRWQSRADEVLEVVESLVREAELAPLAAPPRSSRPAQR